MKLGTSVLYFPPHHSSRLQVVRICLHYPARCLDALFQPGASLLLLRHPVAQTRSRWYGNFHPLSVDYASRPRLRSRLTLGGRSFPRNPWAFGGGDSHPSFRYSYRHSHFHALHPGSPRSFSAHGTLPYHANVYHPMRVSGFLPHLHTVINVRIQSFGDRFSPVTFSAQRHSTSELLRTL